MRSTYKTASMTATTRYRQLLARKYGILGQLTLCGSRLHRGLDGTVGIRVTS
mgnify:CR=1 FL=1